jgi:hypothetical protein
MTGTWQCQEYNNDTFQELKYWTNWHAFNYAFFDWPLDSESYWPDNEDGTNATPIIPNITCITRYINGNRHSEYHYRNGLPFGTWKRWKVNGTLELAKTHHSSGKRGTIQYFYPDGTPECTADFINYNLDSHVIVRYPSGQKEIETWYDSGIVTGTLACFHENGTEQIPGEYAEKYLPFWQADNEMGEIRLNIIWDSWNTDINLFSVLLTTGSFAQAEAYIEDPNFRWKGNSSVRFKWVLAMKLVNSNQYDKAEKYLHEIEKDYTFVMMHPGFYLTLYKVYLEQHKYFSALHILICAWKHSSLYGFSYVEKSVILKAMIVPVVVIVSPVLMLIILVILGFSMMRRIRVRI